MGDLFRRAVLVIIWLGTPTFMEASKAQHVRRSDNHPTEWLVEPDPVREQNANDISYR